MEAGLTGQHLLQLENLFMTHISTYNIRKNIKASTAFYCMPKSLFIYNKAAINNYGHYQLI